MKLFNFRILHHFRKHSKKNRNREKDEYYFILLSLFVIIMPFQLQYIDFNDIVIDVINYSVMGGYMSRPCNTVTTLQSFGMPKPNPWMLY